MIENLIGVADTPSATVPVGRATAGIACSVYVASMASLMPVVIQINLLICVFGCLLLGLPSPMPSHRTSLALIVCLSVMSARCWCGRVSRRRVLLAAPACFAGSDAHRREVELPALARAKSSFRVPRWTFGSAFRRLKQRSHCLNKS